MDVVKIKGFHTSSINGGWSFIQKNAPFLSGSGENQWLTQGFYFWTDSDYFAHEWGKKSIYGDYAITECLLEIEQPYLLDLVGSVEDQLHFEEMFKKYQSKLNKATGQSTEPTVQAVIEYYRRINTKQNGILPYLALKAQDNYKERNIRFTNQRIEKLPLIMRQQLCLFEEGYHCIKSKRIIYPPTFKEKVDYVISKTKEE
ncbi:hypothetical protein BGP_0809 [Beggiatoa sp. PS]|nr:hypothetical protein BGP_0809 [Beggiatoa sp. PS]